MFQRELPLQSRDLTENRWTTSASHPPSPLPTDAAASDLGEAAATAWPLRDLLDRVLHEAIPLALLVPLVLLIHGYHPWSDDAAIYISGLRKILHPSLFPADAPFVLSHTRVSLFSHVLALLVWLSHLRLDVFILLAYLGSILLFLFACRQFALRLFRDERTSWIATLFAAACFSLPVAGTALFLMDPYLTARSFSTACSILAVVAVLDRSWKRTALWTVLTLAMHPQMGVYLAGFLTVLLLVQSRRPRWALALSLLACLGCGCIWLLTLHAPVTAAYREAILSRRYFFPGLWQWYEWIGLAAPLILLALAWRKSESGSPTANISAACVLVGAAACVAAFAFVHPQGPYLLARVQLLRSFQVIYALGLVMLGGFIGLSFSQSRRWVVPALFLLAAGGMFVAELYMYPGSAHLELPGTAPVNPWGQALVWIRDNTPHNAVFAISPGLVASPAEDLPGFRALADRSVLVDNKDEGVASIFPSVAPLWKQRSDAEAGLDALTPAQRASRLRPWGISWVLLPPSEFSPSLCPYENSVVAVCRLPPA